MKNVNVPRQLLIGAIVSVAVAGLTAAGLSFKLWDTARTSTALTTAMADDLTRSYTLLERVDATRDALQQVLRLRDPDELEKGVETLAAARKAASDLIENTGEAGAAIKAKFTEVAPTEQSVLEAVLRGDLAAGSEQFIETASPQYVAVQGAIRAYQEAARVRGSEQMTDNQAAVARTISIVGIIVACCVVALGAFQWRTRRMLTAQLRRVADELWNASTSLSSASGQVAITSQSVSQGATRQAAALEETSAALEEMSSMTRQNVDHAESAKALASQARSAADQGDADMKTLGTALDEIKGASAGIATIVKSIDEIAFQTNILALNAAVEAARAGEAGMGFAVVADEVRNLAQRAAEAARETSSRIEDTIAKSQRGVELRDKVTVGLRAIVDKARDVDGLVTGIVAASQQQRQGIEQITTGVAEMEGVTQSGAAGAQEGAAAAEELKGLAESVQELVEDLREMVAASEHGAARTWSQASSYEAADRTSGIRRAA